VNDYDSFVHLRRSLFWGVDQPVAMLTFFGDDAGKKDANEYVVVGGYLGLAAQWERFAPDWRLTLARVGLSEFHASEFFTGNGIFNGWNTKERAHDMAALLRTLAQIIHDYSLQSFACQVYVPGWRKANEDYMLEESGFAPFSLAGRVVVQRVRDWCRNFGHDPRQLKCIFDQGSEDWGLLKTRLKVDFDINALDEDRRDIRPLQAADWFAYEIFRETPEIEAAIRTRPRRKSLRALLRITPDLIIFREHDFLKQICHVPEMGIPKRSPQGRAAVRMRDEYRKVGRAWRRFDKRVSQPIKSLKAETPTAFSSEESEVADYISPDPVIASLQAEARLALSNLGIHAEIVGSILKLMRADSPENQDELHNQIAAAMRTEREWTEKYVAAMEKLVNLWRPA
jgi:hypothetical protein